MTTVLTAYPIPQDALLVHTPFGYQLIYYSQIASILVWIVICAAILGAIVRYRGVITADNVKKFINIVFPGGNYRYYIMYISSLVVLGFFVIIFVLTANYLNTGEVIDTGTYVTQELFPSTGFLKEPITGIIGSLLDIFGCAWLLFAIHTGMSIIADTTRGLITIIRWVRR
jgi:hypothetical protein